MLWPLHHPCSPCSLFKPFYTVLKKLFNCCRYICKCGFIKIIGTGVVNHSFSASKFNLENDHYCVLCIMTVNLDVSYQLCFLEKLTQCNLFFNSTMNSRKNKKKRWSKKARYRMTFFSPLKNALINHSCSRQVSGFAILIIKFLPFYCYKSINYC